MKKLRVTQMDLGTLGSYFAMVTVGVLLAQVSEIGRRAISAISITDRGLCRRSSR